VLVLATSNIPHAIDAAFVDRADIKQYVPLPPPEAVYWILRSCLMDLRDKGMIKPCRIPAWGESVAVEHVDEGHVDVVCSKKRRMNGSAGVGGVSKTLLNAARTRRKLQAIARKCHVCSATHSLLLVPCASCEVTGTATSKLTSTGRPAVRAIPAPTTHNGICGIH
jgi:SpoVK/Ycf46/Vps4 family AAA+-type ATPase